MKKWMLLLGALVCVIMIAGCDKKSYSMDQVDSKAYITPDGDLYVEELFTYTFKGKFEGTTRYISPGEHDGIEFFEAYVPPKGKKLGEFSYENLERLKTEWDGENETYYVYDAAKDETKQVYYRYRIDKAAVKYSDVGELDWSFFKNNNQEINHVTLDVFLPSGYNKADVHAFLHDRTGGRITTGGDSAVHYENPKLSEYGEAHLLLLFPQDQLSQMAATDKKISPAELLQKERKREKRMDARDGIMRQAGTVLQVLTAVVLLGALYSVLSVKRISAWFGRRDVTERDLEELDPLIKTYCMRKGKLKSKDVIAGLLSLRSRGYVTVKEVQASKRFLEEPTAPDTTLEFTFHGNKAKLNAADRILVGWLFNPRNVFRLDSMAAPTFKEKQDDRQISEYRKQSQRNAKKFNKWRETLAQTEPYGTEVKFNALLKLLVPLIVIVHYVLLLYLYYADVIPIAGMITAAVLLGIVGILACVKTKTKRWFITYLVGCFIAGTQITHEQGMENYLLFAVSSIVFAVLVPKTVLSKEMLKYRFALLELRKKLLKGEDESGMDPAAAERAAEHAVLLGIVPKYVKNLQKKGVSGLALGAAALPVLLNAELMASLAYTQNHLNFTPPRSPYGFSDGGGSFSSGGDSGGGGGTGAF
ncbi:hypothetical protein J2TS6_51830 [Paenibacillus albilobatus]|uniref:DUF2207 domain-containing protein n=1 Tax=Paenibacillus albilobatus TaxID=2716884 RepID=A0A919XNT3_9BACL|nr:DUF2207 domain-containing protein [Paenibacillus albilobatus]GIO34042.1 hypothetical protein J2TS6_51830 [Paenibacillus albilobatus]